ncbi:hypothetical protein AURDEDRAFT_167403 [Auricularia subglabra TFB-10046 SS5]|nr:hypothetical protein AURDEDRAFT_167403 [Auricularia subglabra TFB-10046 SS5]
MFSRKHQKNNSVDAQAQQQQHPFAPQQPGHNGAANPTNITIQIPPQQQMAQGAQPHVQHQGGGDAGFAPAGQAFHTNDGQAHTFGGPGGGLGAQPQFQQPAGMGTTSLAGGQPATHNFAHTGAATGAGMHPMTGNVAGHTGTLHRGTGAAGGTQRNNLPNPMNIQQAPEGGVAVDGRSGLPLGRPTMGDKVVGKFEQGMGKMVGDWKMHNQGELRATGGKAAAAGQARAPIQ